jgi:hypothetical protein
MVERVLSFAKERGPEVVRSELHRNCSKDMASFRQNWGTGIGKGKGKIREGKGSVGRDKGREGE